MRITSVKVTTLFWPVVLLELAICLFLLTTVGVSDSLPIIILLTTELLVTVLLTKYVRMKGVMYGDLIILVHIAKSAVLFIIVLIYGCDLDGFLISDANSFAKIASEYYLGDFSRYSTKYPVLTNLFYKIFGDNAAMVVFINNCLFSGVGIVLADIMKLLKIKKTKYSLAAMIITLVNPWTLYLSLTYMREATETFFIVLSLGFFLKYWLGGRGIDAVLSVMLTVPTLILHGGYVTVPVCYIVVIMLSRIGHSIEGGDKRGKFLSITKIIIFASAIFLLIFIIKKGYMTNYISLNGGLLSTFQYKQQVGESIGGGSLYVQNIKINSAYDVPLFLIIRALYFLFSPMPWHWRGLADASMFFLDSMIAIIAIVCGLKMAIKRNRNKIQNGYRSIVWILLFIIAGIAIVFGVGTNTAGTALRHRNILMPIYGIMLSIYGMHRLSGRR